MIAEIENYLEEAKEGCKEQKALAKYVRRIFREEKLQIDEEKLQNYISCEKYFPFNLLPWEKFLLCLWDCTYTEDDQPRWDTVFVMVGRGSGKDGFMAFNSFCSISPYNPILHYDVDICANNEEQATRPCLDIAEVLEKPNQEKKLSKFYYHTKQAIQGKAYKGCIKGRTNNPNGRDGMRSGKIIFNEVHQYQNYDNIKVFTTGLGKVAEARTGIFTSNGEVNDGPLDDYLAKSNRILFEGEKDYGFLPFICKLDEKNEVHDSRNWYKANPSLKDMPNLFKEIEREYQNWKDNPEQNGDFITKRMGIRQGFKEISVTEYDKIRATNKPLPDLSGWNCTVGIDYAELSDWCAVNIHFRRDNDRYDINHAWICRDSKTLPRVKAPYTDWISSGLCTFVEDVTINSDIIANYIAEMGTKYNILGIAMDNFRWTLMSESLRKIGFDAENKDRVHLVRPSDIMKTEPIIQICFDRGYFTWGDNPCLRWAVNNTKRVRSSRNLGVDTGNFIYAKIEAMSRKTDMFMALVASMVIEDKLGSGVIEMPMLPAIRL